MQEARNIKRIGLVAGSGKFPFLLCQAAKEQAIDLVVIAVENEADDVGNLINNLRGKLSGLDGIIDAEGDKVKSFKDSRPSS